MRHSGQSSRGQWRLGGKFQPARPRDEPEKDSSSSVFVKLPPNFCKLYHRVIGGGGCQVSLKWDSGDTSVVSGQSVHSSPLGKLPDTNVRILGRTSKVSVNSSPLDILYCKTKSGFWQNFVCLWILVGGFAPAETNSDKNPKNEGRITSWPVTRYCVEKSTAETRSPSAWRLIIDIIIIYNITICLKINI